MTANIKALQKLFPATAEDVRKYTRKPKAKPLSGKSKYPMVVGEITPEIARAIRRQAGKIILEEGNNEWGFVHITKRHQREIDALSLSAEDFVEIICRKFSEIRSGKNTHIILVKDNADYAPYMAIIKLKLSVFNNEDCWSVSTATVVRRSYFKSGEKKLLWKRS
jgi:hypothetical protein